MDVVAVITGGEAAEVFEFVETTLDTIALFIETFAVGARPLGV